MTQRHSFALALALALLVAAGCKKAPATTADAGASPSVPSKPDPLCVAPFAPGKIASVDEDLTRLIARVRGAPGDADALVLLGRQWVKKARNAHDPGYYLHADGCAQQALVAKPRYAPALHLRALAMLNGHQFASARDLAREMIAADPDDAHALGVLSDALLELGDVDGALVASQRMMDLRPNLPSYARASYLLWLRGDEKGALEAIRLAYDAGRGQPDREPAAWVLTEAAHIFRHRGDVEGALAGYDKALGELPDYPPALVGKARCLVAGEKPSADQKAQALAALEKAFAAEPLVETAWILGKVYALANRDVDAKRAFDDARRIGAQSDPRSLALFLASEGTTSADFEHAAQALAKDRAVRGGIFLDDIEAVLVWRRHTPESLAQARALMARATKLSTPDVRIRMHAAVISGGGKEFDDVLKNGGAQDLTLHAFIHHALSR